MIRHLESSGIVRSQFSHAPISYPESSGSLVSGLVARRDSGNLVPRVLRLLGQRFGRQERLWGNGIFSIFLIGYSGNNEIGEAEVGSMLTLPSIMSRTSQETSVIFQRGQQVTLWFVIGGFRSICSICLFLLLDDRYD